MPEETPKTLNHFALFAFTDAYWSLPSSERVLFHEHWLSGLRAAAQKVEVYQVFPTEDNADILVWSALPLLEKCDTATFFDRFARTTNPLTSKPFAANRSIRIAILRAPPLPPPSDSPMPLCKLRCARTLMPSAST